MPEVSSVDELYALPLGGFIAGRTALAKAAPSREAAAIKALRKPSVAAWVVNQLVRSAPDDVGALLELGASLREATATLSGDELRTLGRQQHQVIHALVQQSRKIAGSLGQTVSDDTARLVDETLHAALADEGLAAQVREARLVEPLQHSGFSLDAGTSAPPKLRVVPKPAPVKRDDSARRARAQADVDAAQSVVDAASATVDEARETHERALAAIDAAAALVEHLEAQLEEANVSHRGLRKRARELDAETTKAEKAARDAQRELDRVLARLSSLG